MDAAKKARTEALRLEFLTLAAIDQATGERRMLADYLARFPAHEAEIAESWLGLEHGAKAAEKRAIHDARRVGPYRLIREIGRGGQGIVWLAEDTRVARQVALKTVPRSPLFGELAPRLQREAEALARIEHSGLGVALDLGADDGVAWIAMRYERGETLAQRLDAGWGHGCPPVQVVGIIEQAARALHAAHEAGFLHRDVKPGNLMLRDDGQVVVLDFGIATHDATHEEASPVPLTLTGEVVGTPGYMAPELLHAGSASVDRRVDIWSLGVTLFECLEGGRPFASPTQEGEAQRAISDERPRLEKTHRGLRHRDLVTLLETALAKDPAHRYASAAAFADDLAKLAKGAPLIARRTGPLARLGRWARRRPALATALACVAALAIATSILFVRAEQRLERFERLADLESARDLLEARSDLLPATPAKLVVLRAWLSRAEALLAREPLHQRTLEALAHVDPPRWSDPDETGDSWVRAQLEDLLVELTHLSDFAEFVASREALAASAVQLASGAYANAWGQAATRVASDPRFAGFALAPILGLKPLGPDPHSKLEEFAHLATGDVPLRDPASGQLQLDAACGVVLILVPTGETVVGTSNPGDGAIHPDPFRGPWDGPPQTLRLDPFLVSKFELTQSQWERQRRTNPSYLTEASRWIEGPSLLHPLESVPQKVCGEALAEMGLALPTEAQWEHCARAGSTTPWSFGSVASELGRYGNISDRTVLPHNDEVGWSIEEEVEDGFVGHAPIGSFAPNAWGLHDVHGNVSELTRSTFEDWGEHPPKDGSGETDRRYDLIVSRGGGYDSTLQLSRTSNRNGLPDSVAGASIGLRPVLPYGR